MNKGLIIGGTVLAAVLFAGVWVVLSFISYQNRAVALETRFEATHKKVKGTFDNMWRIIEGKAGVSAQYKDDFLEVVRAQTEGRKGGDMMKFIQEVAPNLDASLYRDVANAIESQRTGFLNSEVELLSIKQQHDNLRLQIPSSLFVGGRAALKYDVITSARTERAFETGQDDSDADPFRSINRNRKLDALETAPAH